jgi:hypothetical protein
LLLSLNDEADLAGDAVGQDAAVGVGGLGERVGKPRDVRRLFRERSPERPLIAAR